MAKKIIIMILALILLSINVSAEFLDGTINPPTYISYVLRPENDSRQIFTYPADQKPIVRPFQKNNQIPGLMLWTSNLLPDTMYKIIIDYKPHVNQKIGTTGFLEKSDSVYVKYTPVEQLLDNGVDFSVTRYGQSQYKVGYDDSTNIIIPPENYQIFHDATNKYIAILFLNQEIHENIYINIGMGMVEEGTEPNIDIEMVQNNVQGQYSDILNEIKNTIENLEFSGGGVSQEQVEQAVQDALNAHDQVLEGEVSTLLDNILDQIDGLVSPYSDAADQINTAFDGLSDVFASTSTASVFTFPAGRMPNGVMLWPAHAIDIGAAWLRIPAKFRAVVQIVCTFAILYAAISEAVFVIRFIILGRRESADD